MRSQQDRSGAHKHRGYVVMTADVWWFMVHCESYCKANGIPLNPELYLQVRPLGASPVEYTTQAAEAL